MNKFLCLLLVLATAACLQAQEYNLNNYKYRFQRYQYALFNFSFAGNNNYNINRSAFKDSFPNSSTRHSNTDKNTLDFRLALPFNFYRVINTEKLQHNQSLSTSFDFSNTSEIRNRYNYKNFQFQYNNNNRFYNGLRFTELNYSVSTQINNNNSYSGNNYSYKYHSTYQIGNFALSLGKGKGRLEFVTDAVTTMFLLKDLKRKAGIGNYTTEQIENIAKGITKIYNTRFMDYRYRLIDQLTLLDSTLKSNGIEPASSIRYFTTINDNWLYANRFQRMSGSRWSVNYNTTGGSNYYVRRQKTSDTTNYQDYSFLNNNFSNGLSVNYTWSKQMGLTVQQSFSSTLSSRYSFNTQQNRYSNINTVSTEKFKPDFILTALDMNYGYLFQPNTRTYVQFNLELYGSYSNYLYGMRLSNPHKIQQTAIQAQLLPSLNIFKFFTPRFYYSVGVTAPINATSNINVVREKLINTSTSYQMPISINMGFTYTFF